MLLLAALPSLHALHCFDVVARAGSFSAAAREMHLTHGAISRQIRLLEDTLGVRLFVRGGRAPVLTAEGRELVLTTERAFLTLRDGLSALQRRRSGPIVVSCEPTLTVQWLIPRLAGLQKRAPDLAVHVASSGGTPDFDQSGAHLAIRRQDFPIPAGVTCAPFMEEWLGPVCSPKVARALCQGDRLRVSLLSTRTRPRAFVDWMGATDRQLPMRRELVFDHFAESLQAAIAGLGLAMGPYPLVLDAVAAGRLVAPFGFLRSDVGYALLSPGPGPDDPRVATLRHWLEMEGRRTRPAKAARDTGARANV